METQNHYGDEKTGYSVLVRDMSPEDAKDYIRTSENDGLIMRMNPDRLKALHKRAEEKK